MSVTRQQLKSIVKECLVEILAEGIGSSTKKSIQESSLRTNNVVSKKTNNVQPRRGDGHQELIPGGGRGGDLLKGQRPVPTLVFAEDRLVMSRRHSIKECV